MKKSTFLLLAFILSVPLLWISCDNDGILSGTTIIEGQVLAYGTNEPVENATVTLYERVSTGSFSGADVAVETIITDASGSYSFESEGLGLTGVNATHDNYFEPNMITYDGIVYKNRNNIDIVIDPHAWLKLHIKNVNPFDQNDYINVNGFITEGPWHGMSIDINPTMLIRGNKENKIAWFITKNNISTNQFAPIYCEGHDTTYFEIFY